MERYDCDLHCHTTRSDGNDTPEELIEEAASLGMKAVAITDHDVSPPLALYQNDSVVDIREYARKKGVELLLGCEFSTDTHVDDVHIIGFDLDWSHGDLLLEAQRAKRSKSDAYRALCQRLTEQGMPVDFEADILSFQDGAGRSCTRAPDEVERKFIFEAMAEKGFARSWEQAKLLVRDDPSLNIPREKIHPLECIQLIHRCRGLAVLAHPYLIDEEVLVDGSIPMGRGDYLERLIGEGLDGIEACYTYHKTSYRGNKTVGQIEREIREKYASRLFFSGGSDYHAEARKGKTNQREIGEAGISWKDFLEIFGERLF